MSQREIHYEIFKRVGAKGGWTLHDVNNRRDAALEIAKHLMTEENATGVKVVKETYHIDTGDYQTLKIFEDGHNKMKVEVAAEDAPHALPCFMPDDLYSYHARNTMGRLLAEYLARQRLTITELIHRADALEKLEATGTVYQHAIQKVAVAQAANTQTSVQTIVKSLNELSTKAMERVYRDQRRDYFPQAQVGQFAALARSLADKSDKSYLLNGAIARFLSDANGWDEKLMRLLSILNEAQGDDAASLLLLAAVDSIGAEILNGSAALHELIGNTENLGASLFLLVHLFLGQPMDGARSGIAAVTQHFAADDLPESRTAVANRILAELKSVKRLCPNSLVDELKTLRKIANKLVLGQGKYLSNEDLIAAFTLRSKRLVANEAVAEHLQEAGQPDAKIERLLLIEENIIGIENKRQLSAFFAPIITSSAFEAQFLFAKTPILARLQRLTELQSRTRRAGFQDLQKQEICDALDKVASDAEGRAKLIEGVEAKAGNNVEKAVALLRLCSGGVLTEGRLMTRARNSILSCMGQTGFMTGYVAHTAKAKGAAPNPDAATAELIGALEKAGIDADTGLKSIAA
ncbi:MAG TPA: hypothetical protein VL971_01205 [Rhizomicrobium sp.]|nr:hypothetical protein [Rhizomicrobium sp.]